MKRTVVVLFFISLLVSGCVTTQSDWEKTRTVDTIAAYEAFLDKYPQSKFTVAAKARAAELQDIAQWKKAQTIATQASYEEYLKKQSSGRYRLDAQQKIADLEEHVVIVQKAAAAAKRLVALVRSQGGAIVDANTMVVVESSKAARQYSVVTQYDLAGTEEMEQTIAEQIILMTRSRGDGVLVTKSGKGDKVMWTAKVIVWKQ